MSGEKTEKATPRKRQQLRKKGVVARSAELPAGVTLVALVLVLPAALAKLATALRAALAAALTGAADPDLTVAKGLAVTSAGDVTRALAPVLLALFAVSLVASALVSRSAPNGGALRPRSERVNPKQGVRRLVSVQVVADLVKATAKLVLLSLLAVASFRTGYAALMGGPFSLDALLHIVGAVLSDLLLQVALLALAVGVADAWWVRRRHGKQSRMSKEDVKEEAKSTEGNPQIKGAIRARQAKLSRSRMIAAVAGADVVLANPTHLVVALRYEPGAAAPTVVAKGAGVIADRIKAEAAKHDVPVVEDKPLARSIYRAVEIGQSIPIELYRAVAEVLALVYSARRKRPRRTA